MTSFSGGRLRRLAAVFALLSFSDPSLSADERIKAVAWVTRCADKRSKDQDDLCVWVHLTEASQSLVIAADKAANTLWVYDLAGKSIQSLSVPHPGNIDVRYDFPLGEKKLDIVACNQRDGKRIVVYGIDAATRGLERIDDDSIATGDNYGGALYKSAKSGRFYFVTTSYSGQVGQYELSDNGKGRVSGRKRREWKIGLCEAAVADDASGKLYIAEERKGVWEIGAEPDDAAPGKLVVNVGENGLTGDVEGLALYPVSGEHGYLLVSNQGSDNFHVYRRDESHSFVGAFAIEGGKQSDGIDVCNVNLGPRFPSGLFACHAEHDGKCPILLARWDVVARAVSPKLKIDAARDPRK